MCDIHFEIQTVAPAGEAGLAFLGAKFDVGRFETICWPLATGPAVFANNAYEARSVALISIAQGFER
jgi:hypothetical protein